MRFVGLFYVVILIILLCSCGFSHNAEIESSPDHLSMSDLITAVYSEDTLKEICNFTGDLEELDKIYPAECIRDMGDRYRVAYCGKEYIAILTFDKAGKIESGRCCRFSPEVAVFASVLEGMSLDEVMDLDPNGDYSFQFTGRNDYRASTHYTPDGFRVDIWYDDHLCVERLAIYTI